MRGEQAIIILEIKKKSGLSLNPDIHHSKVFSSEQTVLTLVLVLGIQAGSTKGKVSIPI